MRFCEISAQRQTVAGAHGGEKCRPAQRKKLVDFKIDRFTTGSELYGTAVGGQENTRSLPGRE